uniref:P n=1 Tax=Pelargonium radula virus 1 TaxID=2793734 RepID=A0A8D9PH10_9RHAB|nr:TPA_asm: P [Pelargonium radula virus 1]
MAEEPTFDDLDYGMDPHHAVLSDSNLDGECCEDAVPHNKVPDTECQDDDECVEDNLVDFSIIKEALGHAGQDFGIPITPEMENYVLSLSSTLDSSGDALSWFVAAISYQTNMKTLPTMINLIEDMRAEIKSLQSTNKSLYMTSGDIIKKMTGVKDDILSGFEGLRRSVLDKIVAIPTQVEAVVTGGKVEPQTIDKGRGIKETNKPVPEKSPKQGWVVKDKGTKAMGKSITTKEGEGSQAESLVSAKKKYLIKIGIDPSFVTAIPNTLLDKLITSDELMLFIEKWGSPEAEATKDEVEIRVMMVENDLFD